MVPLLFSFFKMSLVEWLTVSCGIFQVVVYQAFFFLQRLLICWFCGLSIRTLIIRSLILLWTRVSQLPYFLGTSFGPFCSERALPKCLCDTLSRKEPRFVSVGRPGSGRVLERLPQIYPKSLGEGWWTLSVSGPLALRGFSGCTLPDWDIRPRRVHLSLDFSWLCWTCCVRSVCRHVP